MQSRPEPPANSNWPRIPLCTQCYKTQTSICNFELKCYRHDLWSYTKSKSPNWTSLGAQLLLQPISLDLIFRPESLYLRPPLVAKKQKYTVTFIFQVKDIVSLETYFIPSIFLDIYPVFCPHSVYLGKALLQASLLQSITFITIFFFNLFHFLFDLCLCLPLKLLGESLQSSVNEW